MCLKTVLGAQAVWMTQTVSNRVWHQCHDWHIEERLDMLDSGVLSEAMVLLAFCASGSLMVVKTTQPAPLGLVRGPGNI